MSSSIDRELQNLVSKYDGDNDLIPGAPRVTWADWVLLQAIMDLQGQVRALEKQIKHLERPSAGDWLANGIDPD